LDYLKKSKMIQKMVSHQLLQALEQRPSGFGKDLNEQMSSGNSSNSEGLMSGILEASPLMFPGKHFNQKADSPESAKRTGF
jgi:hypothetical protein